MPRLSEQIFQSLKLSKVFDSTSRVNSMSFNANGETLVVSRDDDSIHLYDCLNGAPKTMIYSKKYGVSNVTCTHHPSAILHSATKKDHTIRYLSLHDNKYLRYFVGHTERVRDIAMSPINDTFLSAGADGVVRLWDLRSPHCQGLLQLPSILASAQTVVAYDPQGKVFVVGVSSTSCGTMEVKLYDTCNFDEGPFATFNLSRHVAAKEDSLCGIEVSHDGKLLLLSTDSTSCYLVDAFDGVAENAENPLRVLTGQSNDSRASLHARFSPDGRHVLCGSDSGPVHVWRTDSGEPIVDLHAHSNPTEFVAVNPKHLMVATASASLGFWLPQV